MKNALMFSVKTIILNAVKLFVGMMIGISLPYMARIGFGLPFNAYDLLINTFNRYPSNIRAGIAGGVLLVVIIVSAVEIGGWAIDEWRDGIHADPGY